MCQPAIIQHTWYFWVLTAWGWWVYFKFSILQLVIMMSDTNCLNPPPPVFITFVRQNSFKIYNLMEFEKLEFKEKDFSTFIKWFEKRLYSKNNTSSKKTTQTLFVLRRFVKSYPKIIWKPCLSLNETLVIKNNEITYITSHNIWEWFFPIIACCNQQSIFMINNQSSQPVWMKCDERIVPFYWAWGFTKTFKLGFKFLF